MERIAEKPTSCTFCHGRIEEGEKVWVEGDKAKEGASTTCATCFWGEKPEDEPKSTVEIDALRKEIVEVLNSNTKMQGEIEGWRSLVDGYSDEVLDLRSHIEVIEENLSKAQELSRSNRKIVKGLFEMVKRMAKDITVIKPTGEDGALSLIDELIKIREETGI